jgi:hypothetical protein
MWGFAIKTYVHLFQLDTCDVQLFLLFQSPFRVWSTPMSSLYFSGINQVEIHILAATPVPKKGIRQSELSSSARQCQRAAALLSPTWAHASMT